MRLIKTLLLIIAIHIGSQTKLFSQANIPVGTWRVHLTYHTAKNVAIGDNKVYCSAENSLFVIDLEDNSINVLSKINGLSDAIVGALGYSDVLNTLVIAYENGNIDLLTEDGIVNIRTILNSDFDDKTIYHINIDGIYAYFSTGFGVVKLDLTTYRIQETYNDIGLNGSSISVFSTTFYRDSIFIASDQGLMGAPLANTINKQDFNSWRMIVQSTNMIKHVASLGGICFFTKEGEGFYAYEKGDIRNLGIASEKSYKSLTTDGNEVFLCTGEEIVVSSPDFEFREIKNEDTPSPFDVVTAQNGGLWIADNKRGLLRLEQSFTESFTPSGTFDPSAFKLNFFDTKMMALSGGYNNEMIPQNNFSGFYVFDEDGQWDNFTSLPNAIGAKEIPPVADLVASKINFADGLVYLGSFGEGLLTWNQETEEIQFVEDSPLVPNSDGKTFVSGMNVDNLGNLWVSNFNVQEGEPAFHRLNTDGTWDSFVPESNVARFPLEILVDDFGTLWSIISPARSGGIYVFNEELGEERYLTDISGGGNLPDRSVNALAKDINGSIWAGTDDGVAEFFNPGGIFDSQAGDAIIPRFEGRRLLEGEKVTAIEVDGGNRKWIGTLNGVWLFSEDGSELISFFDEENSPLLSNHIIDIEINPFSGEVFFATDRGIISYRGTGTAALAQHQNVKVFPNPVLPTFNGLVSITGLSYNASVKITDISGKLIWETQAAGGTATWNGANYNGTRAKTGIYLVFSASEDGQDTHVAKIAFLN